MQYVIRAKRQALALARVGSGFLVLLLVMGLALSLRPPDSDLEIHERSGIERVLQSLEELKLEGELAQNALARLREDQELLRQGLNDGEIEIDQQTLERLGELGLSEAIPIVRIMCDNSEDPWMHYHGAASLLSLGDKEGIHRLIQILQEEAPAFLKVQVKDRLVEISGEDLGYDPTNNAQENERSVNRWEVWWHQHAEQLVWNSEERKFRVQE